MKGFEIDKVRSESAEQKDRFPFYNILSVSLK
jgi:hypothetical protein